jgi:hypothetical protein
MCARVCVCVRERERDYLNITMQIKYLLQSLLKHYFN